MPYRIKSLSYIKVCNISFLAREQGMLRQQSWCIIGNEELVTALAGMIASLSLDNEYFC